MDFRFGVILIFGGLSLVSLRAEETVTNPDGTKSTTYTIDDELKREKAASHDSYQRSSNDSAKDPRVVARETNAKFPEAQQKEIERQLARAKMTADERDREKRMLDRVPNSLKTINPGMTQRGSFPNRG
jgi:hypothetical protein